MSAANDQSSTSAGQLHVPAKLRWSAGIFVALLAGLLFSASLDPGVPLLRAWYTMSQALFAAFACYLLLPAARDLRGALCNSVGAVLLFSVLSLMPVAADTPALVLFRLGVVVFCLGMLLWSLTQLAGVKFSDERSLRVAILSTAAIITAAPVWLGPVAEVYQPGDVLVGGVVSMSPLSHFSVAAGYDYLRGDWFYRNSAFGSLPFAYPGYAGILTGYFLFVIFIRIIIRVSARRCRNPESPQRSRDNRARPDPDGGLPT